MAYSQKGGNRILTPLSVNTVMKSGAETFAKPPDSATSMTVANPWARHINHIQSEASDQHPFKAITLNAAMRRRRGFCKDPIPAVPVKLENLFMVFLHSGFSRQKPQMPGKRHRKGAACQLSLSPLGGKAADAGIDRVAKRKHRRNGDFEQVLTGVKMKKTFSGSHQFGGWPLCAALGLLLACTPDGGDEQALQDMAVPASTPGATSAAASTPTMNSEEPKTAGDVDFPAIPEIAVPDILGTSPAQAALEQSLGTWVDPIAGVLIQAATCGDDGTLLRHDGNLTRREADGTLTHRSPEGLFRIGPDGAGSAHFNGGQIQVAADGSGSIHAQNGAVIRVEADGSGSYNGPLGIIRLDGRGGGIWNSDKHGIITNRGDGSGSWNGPQGVIRIEADGSGSWNGPLGLIRNHGNGRGSVGTPPREVAMAPLPPLPKAGRFPLLNTLSAPAAPCGVVISLGDQVLFDFDQDRIRTDAAALLDHLAQALQQAKGIQTLEVQGHTDAKGSDAYNLDLSQRRAEAVAAALRQRGLNWPMETRGFGESQPVAANDIDGHDNPAGRQRNRRVEIFVRQG